MEACVVKEGQITEKPEVWKYRETEEEKQWDKAG